MSTFTNTAREVEMPNGDVVVIHNAPTGGENTTSNIKKFKYDDNGHVTESTAADAEDLNLSGYSTPTTGTTDIGTSDDVQTAIGKLDHQSHIDQTNILLVEDATEELVDKGAKNIIDIQTPDHTRDTSIVPLTNGGITISCTNALWTQYRKSVSVIPNKAYKFIIYVDSISEGLQNFDVLIRTNETTPVGLGEIENIHITGAYHINLTPTTDSINVDLFLNNTETAKTQSADIRVLLCSMAEWKISQQFEPHALPNYDLTQLQSEDRAALAEVVDSGAKNRIKLTQPSGNGITFNPSLSVTVNEKTGVVTVSGTTVASDVIYLTDAYSNLDGYVLSGKPEITEDYLLRAYSVVGDVSMADDAGDGNGGVISGNQECRVSLYVYANKSYNFTFKPMICTQADWNISKNYAPFALPNSDLTQREQQDRNALVGCVDEGAKNLIDLTAIKEINTEGTWNGNVFTHNNGGIFTVNQDATITVNTTQSIGNCYFWIAKNVSMNSTKTYILSGCPSGGSVSTYFIKLNNGYKVDSGNGVGFTGISTDDVVIGVLAGTQVSVIFKPMICTEADWNISHAFAPYRKNLDQLDATKAPALVGLVTSGSLDDITENTFALYTNNVSNLPTNTSYYYVETNIFDTNNALQRAYDSSDAESYVRTKYSNTWSAWKQTTNA